MVGGHFLWPENIVKFNGLCGCTTFITVPETMLTWRLTSRSTLWRPPHTCRATPAAWMSSCILVSLQTASPCSPPLSHKIPLPAPDLTGICSEMFAGSQALSSPSEAFALLLLSPVIGGNTHTVTELLRESEWSQSMTWQSIIALTKQWLWILSARSCVSGLFLSLSCWMSRLCRVSIALEVSNTLVLLSAFW